MEYFDGGVCDPIPVKQALADGCDNLIVVLTQPRGYRKHPQQMQWVVRRVLKRYPNVVAAIARRHEVYNATLALLDKLEANGIATIIAPSAPLGIDKFEKNRDKLMAAHALGMQDAQIVLNKL